MEAIARAGEPGSWPGQENPSHGRPLPRHHQLGEIATIIENTGWPDDEGSDASEGRVAKKPAWRQATGPGHL
jgi:hypothetical protein